MLSSLCSGYSRYSAHLHRVRSGLAPVRFSRVAYALLIALALFLKPLISFAEESYSPYVAQSYPDQVYWGDTHVHTAFSWDGYNGGTRVMPEDAYRFAKGETVTADNGQEVRLRRPLDFLMVADHAEALGGTARLAAGDAFLMGTEEGKRMAKVLKAGGVRVADVLGAETDEAFLRFSNAKYALLKFGRSRSVGKKPAAEAKKKSSAKAKKKPGVAGKKGRAKPSASAKWSPFYDERFRRSVWREVGAVAERHNDPGKFTTFIGYEWTANIPGRSPNIHRNIVFADGPKRTDATIPFAATDSRNVEDLWTYLEDYEENTGGRALAIPHNGNLSSGAMFALTDLGGKPLTRRYAEIRSRWEPLYEVTQIKGDGETHPILSPTDEFADYETWAGVGSKNWENEKQSEYGRSALKLGLGQEAKLGVNPFKFGMIGSTDTHTSLSTADEDDFWGKESLIQPSRYRATVQWMVAASGYAAVWATENTREALFDAMKRREVYASTGPRITLRLFGGWDYEAADALRPDLARIGYAKGVPMGGDLTNAPEGASPRFLIRAVKDHDGANLDRVQIIKGWRDADGTLHEKIYDVALSDGRQEDAAGRIEPVGSTVDVADASYANSIGDPELAVVWVDPDFDPEELAFYYLRVLEIPTPRWTAYDAKFYGLKDLPENIPMVTQERAYSSPIWYTP
jgi:hypothetical protein